jgi:Fe-Mn family superoxide dismutase
MKTSIVYKPRHFDLSGLKGISDKTLEVHFGLYEGYVRATNQLAERIDALLHERGIEKEEAPAYSELKRRLGFEYNGMLLHELYFENLMRAAPGGPEPRSGFAKAAEGSFGSLERWRTDFVGVGSMRGVGWAICYLDPANQRLSNHWVSLHHLGNVAGFRPILVMDVWEHAYLLDHAPSERGRYIDAFFSNVDWRAVERRLQQ